MAQFKHPPGAWPAVATLALVLAATSTRADEWPEAVHSAIERAGDNRPQIRRALESVPAEQAEAMQFLVANMPDRDLTGLSAEFLLENVAWAYRAREASPWKDCVSNALFLNNVLPYANVNERRDNWRKDFFQRFAPLVEGIDSPGRAAVVLNQKIFATLNVRYSRRRPKADQSPYESIEASVASCTGLSVLLVDACRAVGVPARLAGTPLWSDHSGNHTWVEVWDDGWHFTGAAEPSGDALDRGWFAGRCAGAQRDHRLHAIYAVSFRRTPQTFPLVWNPRVDYVFAVNVTDRYTRRVEELPAGHVRAMFRVLDRPGGDRRAAAIRVFDAQGKPVFEGKTNDERFDANDHVTVALRRSESYRVELQCEGRNWSTTAQPERQGQLFTFYLKDFAAEK